MFFKASSKWRVWAFFHRSSDGQLCHAATPSSLVPGWRRQHLGWKRGSRWLYVLQSVQAHHTCMPHCLTGSTSSERLWSSRFQCESCFTEVHRLCSRSPPFTPSWVSGVLVDRGERSRPPCWTWDWCQKPTVSLAGGQLPLCWSWGDVWRLW